MSKDLIGLCYRLQLFPNHCNIVFLANSFNSKINSFMLLNVA